MVRRCLNQEGRLSQTLETVSVMMAAMVLVCPILKIAKFNSTFDLKGQHSFNFIPLIYNIIVVLLLLAVLLLLNWDWTCRERHSFKRFLWLGTPVWLMFPKPCNIIRDMTPFTGDDHEMQLKASKLFITCVTSDWVLQLPETNLIWTQRGAKSCTSAPMIHPNPLRLCPLQHNK